MLGFIICHIYREGNFCVDKLVNYGILNVGFLWWDTISTLVRECFFRDRAGLPNYRFR
ncbi:hypothetical protein JHK85_023131 [Glycine max]|nr:hypothetical protein JHK85_023131 [Glycine max]